MRQKNDIVWSSVGLPGRETGKGGRVNSRSDFTPQIATFLHLGFTP
jgi:hypothetical protein